MTSSDDRTDEHQRVTSDELRRVNSDERRDMEDDEQESRLVYPRYPSHPSGVATQTLRSAEANAVAKLTDPARQPVTARLAQLSKLTVHGSSKLVCVRACPVRPFINTTMV